jgi:hypothetical protein
MEFSTCAVPSLDSGASVVVRHVCLGQVDGRLAYWCCKQELGADAGLLRGLTDDAAAAACMTFIPPPPQANNINMNIIWTAASLVLTRCFAVYTSAQTQRTMLQQQMTSSLYDKMQDSQEGVISVITEVRVSHRG